MSGSGIRRRNHRSAMVSASVPNEITELMRYEAVRGRLEGFIEVGGRHYPRYSYESGDRVHVDADMAVSMEDAFGEQEARMMLRVGMPLPITVRVNRHNPEDSRCATADIRGASSGLPRGLPVHRCTSISLR